MLNGSSGFSEETIRPWPILTPSWRYVLVSALRSSKTHNLYGQQFLFGMRPARRGCLPAWKEDHCSPQAWLVKSRKRIKTFHLISGLEGSLSSKGVLRKDRTLWIEKQSDQARVSEWKISNSMGVLWGLVEKSSVYIELSWVWSLGAYQLSLAYFISLECRNISTCELLPINASPIW